MLLNVQLAADADPAAIAATVNHAGAELTPMHPGVQDALLSRQYVVEVPDGMDADALQRELLGMPGVDGAYSKPDTFLP